MDEATAKTEFEFEERIISTILGGIHCFILSPQGTAFLATLVCAPSVACATTDICCNRQQMSARTLIKMMPRPTTKDDG